MLLTQAEELEPGVPLAVSIEGGAAAMRCEAVDLDDQALIAAEDEEPRFELPARRVRPKIGRDR